MFIHIENCNIVKYCLLVGLTFFQLGLNANLEQMNRSPLHVMRNLNPTPSLVNSVDFHPKLNLFCVTFTHNDQVVLYQLDEADRASVFQVLQNPFSQLSCPQHAVFSQDGRSLVVANWCNQTFNVYPIDLNGFYQETPSLVIPYPSDLGSYRPHGIAFSPDGNYLAVAFGASQQYSRAVALYRTENLETAQGSFELLSLFEEKEITEGIPKGIAFSPDGSCLIVTLSETNSVAIYTIDWPNVEVNAIPRQILTGASTYLSRPEDIKFTANGHYCAVSNSDKDTVTFYAFDRENNCFVGDTPSYILENPEAQFCFPHGLAFSSDGKYLSVTQFGPVVFDKKGDLSDWGKERKDSIAIYKIGFL